MQRAHRAVLFVIALALPVAVMAQGHAASSPFWLSAGIGGASVNSLEPAPSAGRSAVAASIELGYRIRPEIGVGLELGTIAPLRGCAEWQCGEARSEFAPAFNRLFAFGTFRPKDSGWNLRAGLGVSRFCYQRHWSPDAWSWRDTVDLILDEDVLYDGRGGSGAWRCDARQNALGGSLSVGYDWRVARSSPVSMGVRLTAEAANYGRNAAMDLPAFRHRALVLTLHLGVN